MKLIVEKDPNALSENLASWLVDYIEEVLTKKEYFSFVLSGGSTPKLLYSLLAQSPHKERIAWEQIVFFWGDERAVPFEDSRNNAKMCYDELLYKVPVKKENIHVMRTDLLPEESARDYERVLNAYFKDSDTTFDFVLLGMGDDGHTLSLFPGTEVVHEQERWATSFFLTSQDMYRITLTAPVVNKAASVAFLATGTGKAQTLKEVLKGEKNIDLYPSQIIQPSGELLWFVDEQAASQLSR
jgi:6-phosphogluconolactonase